MTTTGKHVREDGGKLKGRLLAIAAAAACCALLAGGSLAYFVASERAHNVITSGGVDVELLEWADYESKTPWTDETKAEIMPGTSVEKVVEVQNTGASDAWVRVKIDIAFTVDGESRDAGVILCSLPAEGDENWKNWQKTTIDGVDWWYYQEPLAAGEVTAPLFRDVTLQSATGNDYQNGTATVSVYVQAVQVANNGSTVLEAAGWPSIN